MSENNVMRQSSVAANNNSITMKLKDVNRKSESKQLQMMRYKYAIAL